MPAELAHLARVADRQLLRDVGAACHWWDTQRTWRVSSSYTGGGVIAALEQVVARGVAQDAVALALPSATASLSTALRAAGLEQGAIVGVPALDWTATCAVAAALGIRTRPLPVSPETKLLDVAAVIRDPGLTVGLDAVIAVHLHGLTCDVPALRRARPGLPVIEDAAQAWAARYPDGAPVGSAALACAFSFGAAKSPSAGELGCLVTRRQTLYRSAVALTQHPARQLLAGITSPRCDQAMTRVAPVVALLGAYAVQRHADQVPILRQAAVLLGATLRAAGLTVLSDPARHVPGTVAVAAPAAQVRDTLNGITLAPGVSVASVEEPSLYIHPDAPEVLGLRQQGDPISTVTAACHRRWHRQRR